MLAAGAVRWWVPSDGGCCHAVVLCQGGADWVKVRKEADAGMGRGKGGASGEVCAPCLALPCLAKAVVGRDTAERWRAMAAGLPHGCRACHVVQGQPHKLSGAVKGSLQGWLHTGQAGSTLAAGVLREEEG